MAVRLGWRLIGGELVYKHARRLEEGLAGLTNLEKTSQVLDSIMNSICSRLHLTMEHVWGSLVNFRPDNMDE